MKKKLLSCLLVGAMVLGILSGCGKTEQKSSEASSSTPKQESSQASSESKAESSAPVEEKVESPTYPLEGKPKFTVGIPPQANVTAIYPNGFKDAPVMKEWQKQTGVEVEFIETKDLNLLIASGELPDIIFGWNGETNYPGGYGAAITDKVIAPITDVYEKLAPDFAKLLHENPEEYAAWFNGELYGFPYLIESEYLTVSSGIIIRQDWLDDLGLKQPTNHEEMYTVLKAFKEKKGAEFPLGMSSGQLLGNMIDIGMFASSFGIPRGDFCIVDGKVQPPYCSDGYKAAIEWYHKLYEEGLVDPNLVALTGANQTSYFLNGKSGVMFGAIGSTMGGLLDATKDDPNFKLAGVAPFKDKGQDKAYCTQYSGRVMYHGAVITTACKDFETAVKFLNFGYTDAGLKVFNFGIEGESYKMVDGAPQYTDTIRSNPSMTTAQAMACYTRALHGGPFMQQEAYMRAYNNRPEQIAAMENWCQSNSAKYILPKFTMSDADKTEFNNIMSDLWTYYPEALSKFITGQRPLSEWDQYVKEMNDFGAQRVTEINQKYYDEWLKTQNK